MSKYAVDQHGFHFDTYVLHPASDMIFLGIPAMVLSYHPESNKFEEVFAMASILNTFKHFYLF